jgi:hypothetical protein
MGPPHTLDRLDICFDDTHAVANVGLLLQGSWLVSVRAAVAICQHTCLAMP